MKETFKMIDGQEYVNVAGVILLSVMALSDGSPQRATDMINRLVDAASAKGYASAASAKKILMRGVIDDFTQTCAHEVADYIKAQDLQQVLSGAGFPMAGKLQAQNVEGVDILNLKKPETDTKDG